MNMSGSIQTGRHCSRGVCAVALVVTAPVTWGQAASPAEKPKALPPVASKPLDLYQGRARELLSNTQWERILATQPLDMDDADASAPEPAVVKVTSERSAPEVPDGIAGIFWALRHPTQAWRIFAPASQ
jgi:hypothetical protein